MARVRFPPVKVRQTIGKRWARSSVDFVIFWLHLTSHCWTHLASRKKSLQFAAQKCSLPCNYCGEEFFFLNCINFLRCAVCHMGNVKCKLFAILRRRLLENHMTQRPNANRLILIEAVASSHTSLLKKT